MVTQDRIDILVKEIFSRPLPLKKKRKHKRRSISLLDNWEQLRRLVIERDKVCQDCGGKGEGVHHKDLDRENNCLDNLVYLCWQCHMKHHHG